MPLSNLQIERPRSMASLFFEFQRNRKLSDQRVELMPRTGLNIPIVTALDEAGNLIESDQRRIVNHTIQHGRGAESLFICGTTGEFNRLTNPQRQQLMEVATDETRRVNAELKTGIFAVEAWLGVTAETKAKTLENLRLAKELKADMAVIAPLAITDLAHDEIVEFFEGDISKTVGSTDALPIGLYENPDIAADPEVLDLLPLSIINKLRRLPIVVCLKASTSREASREYLKAFAPTGEKADFPLYFGNAPLIFDAEAIQREAGLTTSKVLVAGVVSGTANLFPTEWRQAWQWIIADDRDRSAALWNSFADFIASTDFRSESGVTSKLIAGIKQGLHSQGVISSPHVARGTPALTADEAEKVTENLDKVLSELQSKVHPKYLSVFESNGQMAFRS
jgi:dihydrodipicolinate synthase/N-acetylneuraminate lyase